MYYATISEEINIGGRVTSVKAKDADLGMSGVVRYTLFQDAPNFLEINKYDGRIIVSKTPSLDYLQLGTKFMFHVIASDRGTI